MLRKITLAAAAALISMGMMGAATTSASASSYGYKSCHSVKVKVPVYKTVWRTKKVAIPYGCGWQVVKYKKTIKVWRTVWKKSCH